MTNEHYDHPELTKHLTDPREEIAQHVDSCRLCAERLEFVREFERALADTATWTGVEMLHEPFIVPPAVLSEGQAIVDADQKAAELLKPALVSIGAFREHGVENRERYRSAGVVRILTREAKKVRNAAPRFTLLLATAAVNIAAKLPDEATVRACVLGAAWLERGIACAMLGRYRDAESALRHAEEAFDDESGTTWDLANVWLSRANVFTETDRLDDALDLASRAASVFLEYGDITRYLSATLVRGVILYVWQKYHESIAIFDEMLSRAEEIEDVVTQARALHNAANCYLAMGELDHAADYYGRAVPLWDQAGSDAEMTRTEWSLATIEVRRGNWQTGYAGLTHARRKLSALGLLNDEGLVRLELAEVLILLGRHAEVPPLLEDIVVRFASEGMTRNARLALASLHEARRGMPLSVDAVRHVREYLGRLPTEPSLRFVPLK